MYYEPNQEAQLNVSNFNNKIFIFKNNLGKNDVVNVADNNSCTVRILPPWSSSGIFLKKVGLIWNLPDDGFCFVSPEVFGKICPFSAAAKEMYEQRKASGDKKLHEQDLNTMRPKFSYYGRVVVFEENGTKYEQPIIKFMRFGVKTYDMLMTYFKEGTGGVPLTGLSKGLNIKVIANGSGLMKSYVPVPIPSEFDVRTVPGIDNVVNLDEAFQVPETSLVYKAFKSAYLKTYVPSEKVLKTLEREYGTLPPVNQPSKVDNKEEDTRLYTVDIASDNDKVNDSYYVINNDSSLNGNKESTDSMKKKIDEMRAKLTGNSSQS